MSDTTYFTICSANYLASALTLAASLGRAVPGTRLRLVLTDRLPPGVAVARDHADLLHLGDLAIDGLADMAFRYGIVEFNTAVKPSVFLHLLREPGCRRAIYLDPDIFVLQPLDHVVAALDAGASCVLTPHITRPLAPDRGREEDWYLVSGMFNLGFAAFADTAESRNFLDWWRGKTRRGCVIDPPRGLYTDQSYCNLAACFIEALHVLRHVAYNLAHWNLDERSVALIDGRYTVDGAPLRFAHFSGIQPRDADNLSRHQRRHTRRSAGAFGRLADEYAREWLRHDEHGAGRYSDSEYGFARFHDGRALGTPLRLAYRRFAEALPAGTDPFALSVADFAAPDPEFPPLAGLTVSRLLAAIWHWRTDLQFRFDLRTIAGRRTYLAWAADAVPREYGIDPAYVIAPERPLLALRRGAVRRFRRG